MKTIDAKAPDVARAASNRRRTACRRTRPVKEDLLENPALIALTVSDYYPRRCFPPAKQAHLVDGLFPQPGRRLLLVFFLQVELQATTGGAYNCKWMRELTHIGVTKIT